MSYTTVTSTVSTDPNGKRNHLHLMEKNEDNTFKTYVNIEIPSDTKVTLLSTRELIDRGYEIIHPRVLGPGTYTDLTVTVKPCSSTPNNLTKLLPLLNAISLFSEKSCPVFINHRYNPSTSATTSSPLYNKNIVDTGTKDEHTPMLF